MVVVIVIVAAVVLLLLAVVVARRRKPDPVDSFRRQIDALSPEARRPTIDRGRHEEPPDDRSSDGPAADDA